MWANILAALYLSVGGSLDWAPDLKDGYTGAHMEPRYSVGAGLSFDARDNLEVDMGIRRIDMPPLPGRVHDPYDWDNQVYLEFRYRPFRKD